MEAIGVDGIGDGYDPFGGVEASIFFRDGVVVAVDSVGESTCPFWERAFCSSRS